MALERDRQAYGAPAAIGLRRRMFATFVNAFARLPERSMGADCKSVAKATKVRVLHLAQTCETASMILAALNVGWGRLAVRRSLTSQGFLARGMAECLPIQRRRSLTRMEERT